MVFPPMKLVYVRHLLPLDGFVGATTLISVQYIGRWVVTIPLTIEPVRLRGLMQASYVMRCMTEGQPKETVTRALGGDAQLVTMWISFLQHNHWMIESNERWHMTAKGRAWNSWNPFKFDCTVCLAPAAYDYRKDWKPGCRSTPTARRVGLADSFGRLHFAFM